MDEKVKRDIALDSQLGFWVMEFFPDAPETMYGDEVMYHVLGVKEELSPECLFQFWFQRIHSDYVNYVEKAIKKVVEGQQTEVEYLWEHPDFGWTLVRGGGNLDKRDHTSTRIRGYYHNITNILKSDLDRFSTHEVIDLYKFGKYAPYLISAYDEIFEIEPETYTVRTIAYKKEKYFPIMESCDILDAIQDHVHEEDRRCVSQLLSPASIQEMQYSKNLKSVEFRAKTIQDKFIWIRGIAFSLELNGQKRILFVTQDIQAQKKVDLLTRDNEDIVQSLVSTKSAIIDINVMTQMTRLLKCDNEELTNHTSNLDTLREDLLQIYLKSDNELVIRQFLSIETLRNCLENKKENSIDLKFKASDFHYEWIRLTILVPPHSSDRVFLLIKNINHEYLLQHIMENFIYNSCDYLYYLDLKNDWFIRFSGNTKRRNLPPEKGTGYRQEMEKFAKTYIPQENLDMVITKMNPEYILKELDKNGYLNFTTGLLDDKGQYARKHMQVQYYDKQNKIVLLQSIDITENYLKQKQINLELEKSKREAKMDFLTQLYNRLGCEDLIQSYIDNCTVDKPSAFLLLDLDNFKLINDSFGHQKGDEVLKTIAQILKSNCRQTDIVARLGGDEFIIFLKELEKKEDIHQLIIPFLEKLNLSYCKDGHQIHLSASAGVTFFEKKKPSTFSTLYREADVAMYQAKRMGKKRYQIYS